VKPYKDGGGKDIYQGEKPNAVKRGSKSRERVSRGRSGSRGAIEKGGQ